MNVNFHKHPAVDFSLRLVLTLIIISPVVYFSWDAVTGTSGSDYVLSVIFILVTGGIGLVNYLFFSALTRLFQKVNK
ncbi:conjugal transfer protein TrbE (plasmid) [Klebsiella pneumoniae]|uniref:conjugal transfer protein TrbE n=1 Tax=Klebsiella TaxID=570 RepID=UPI0025953006|nr:conjugal transfer protein TrbE [Klebsiella oxytoca]MDM4095984.1 conjugal transfer protein TrbE [Klebsiella oxytoca]HBM3279719.1 conjugal transfer protein TrbE [Klebsiella oxytoca]HCQ8367340.1 conjugal transfer protein TrbE [Klebsiella oxytoca]